jgi:hypothetical protein
MFWIIIKLFLSKYKTFNFSILFSDTISESFIEKIAEYDDKDLIK